ncbi:MAG: hypothetical protein KatS3mg114_0996 [Planctomycetaceae bacterium]|nr:MAG: hypothetical protein KatS3mg114_0996 [Planctomycetaceae bacterium]
MSWCQLRAAADHVVVEFQPAPTGYWEPEAFTTAELPSELLRDRRVMMEGRGAIWMYAFVAIQARAAGARTLQCLSLEDPTTVPQAADVAFLEHCRCTLRMIPEAQAPCGLLTVHYRHTPRVTPQEEQALLEQAVKKLHSHRCRHLTLSGRCSVAGYAQLAWTAYDVGAERLWCWSARDGLLQVYAQQPQATPFHVSRETYPPGLLPLFQPTRESCVVGVVGDPNSGKSVLSRILLTVLEMQGYECWLLDCDAAAPTPEWYVSLLDRERAEQIRRVLKGEWTEEKQRIVADQLRHTRRFFEMLIADLPGGNLNVDPPQRIPPGRDNLFELLDAIIVVDRPEKQSALAWQQALAAYGLEGRVAAVLASENPHAPFSLRLEPPGTRVLRGTITGLDRSCFKNDRTVTKLLLSQIQQSQGEFSQLIEHLHAWPRPTGRGDRESLS